MSTLLRLKGRPLLCMVLLFAVFCLVYLYQTNQESFANLKRSEQRCVVEQEFLSSRLQVVIDYKNRMEKSLTMERSEHTKAMSVAKTQHKEEMDALQQHFSQLQSQFDELTVELNKLRETPKTEHEIKDLLKKIQYLEEDNDSLKKRVDQLMEEKTSANVPPYYTFDEEVHSKDKFIKKQVKVERDVYQVRPASNAPEKPLFKATSESSIDLKEPKLVMPSTMNTTRTTSAFPKIKGNLPQGLAPEIIVDDHLMETNYNKEDDAKANSNAAHPNNKAQQLDQKVGNVFGMLFHNNDKMNEINAELPLKEDGEKNMDQVDNPGHDNNLNPDRGEAALNNPEEDGDDVDYYDAHGAVKIENE